MSVMKYGVLIDTVGRCYRISFF